MDIGGCDGGTFSACVHFVRFIRAIECCRVGGGAGGEVGGIDIGVSGVCIIPRLSSDMRVLLRSNGCHMVKGVQECRDKEVY